MAIFAMVLGMMKQMDGNICNGTWHDKVSSEFLCPRKLPTQIDTVKMLKKIAQLLRIAFVALVKFPGNGKYYYKQWLVKEKMN